MSSGDVPFKYTLQVWILHIAVQTIATITELVMITYHCYNIYQHYSDHKPLLHKITITLTITFMLSWFLTQQTSWILLFDINNCSQDISSWAGLGYQIAKSQMYIIFLIRIHIIYYKSKYGYNPKLLIIWSILIIITQIINGIYGSITMIKYSYTISVFGSKTTICTISPHFYFLFATFSLDLINTIGIIIAFTVPLRRIIKSLQNVYQGKYQHDLNKMKFPAIKLTSLTMISLISSILAHPVAYITQTVIIYGLDIQLNVLCVMLTAPYYNKLYSKLCCMIIKCFHHCDRKKDANLKNIIDLDLVQRETVIEPIGVENTYFDTATADPESKDINGIDHSMLTQTNLVCSNVPKNMEIISTGSHLAAPPVVNRLQND